MTTFIPRRERKIIRTPKLQREESILTNSRFGVSEMGREFGKSRLYIHRKLKSITESR